MRATLKEAVRNERGLVVYRQGYGHWHASCEYRGKRISCTTTDSVSVDSWNSDPEERTKQGYTVLRGYRTLCSEIIRSHNNNR
jgi:hypothetical protein